MRPNAPSTRSSAQKAPTPAETGGAPHTLAPPFPFPPVSSFSGASWGEASPPTTPAASPVPFEPAGFTFLSFEFLPLVSVRKSESVAWRPPLTPTPAGGFALALEKPEAVAWLSALTAAFFGCVGAAGDAVMGGTASLEGRGGVGAEGDAAATEGASAGLGCAHAAPEAVDLGSGRGGAPAEEEEVEAAERDCTGTPFEACCCCCCFCWVVD
mmetsp:Transcript_12112/g.23390  ORF Transcript_12112/g.23390 Transcript_12112/m.23390 type:complete len:212 (-) Transcript_12112:724-1359(-)